MTTELVLLLAIFVFVLMTAFFGPRGPKAVFQTSVPRLGARLEENIATGRGFQIMNGGTETWVAPPSAPPSGQL